MTGQELKDRLKSGDLAGAYLFAGEEDYLKKYYLSELRRAVVSDEAFALFNHAVFDGDEVDVAAVREAIKAPPMMADYKLVEWRYPSIDKMRESERDALEELALLTKDYPTIFAVLATADDFDPGTAKRPSKNAKRFEKSFSLLNFEKNTDAQLLAWLKRHFDAEGVGCDAKSLSALLFRAGHSMEVLDGEVKKLCAFVKQNGRSEITEKDVSEVASSTIECDAFALSNAITDKNRAAAFLALADMKMRRVDAGLALAMLEKNFSELLSTALLLDEGKGSSDVESILHFGAYQAKFRISAAKRFGTERLSAALERLLSLDAASKSGGVTGFTAIETFLAEFL